MSAALSHGSRWLSHNPQLLGSDGQLTLGAYVLAVLVLTVLAAIAASALLGGVALARDRRSSSTRNAPTQPDSPC